MGLEHHLKGLEYEKIILNNLNRDSSFRKLFIEFLKNKFDLCIDSFVFEDSSLLYTEALNNKKLRIKPDIFSKDLSFGCSIKNTRSSFQVLCSNIHSFLEICKSFDASLVSSDFEVGMNKYLGTNSFGPNDLGDDTKLKQKDRNRYLFHELSLNEQKAIESLLGNKDFLKHYFNIFWKSNQISDENFHAKILIVNKVKFSVTQRVDPVIIKLDDLINKDIEKGFSISKNGIIRLGKNSFNIKGSGDDYSHYHSIQIKRTIDINNDF